MGWIAGFIFAWFFVAVGAGLVQTRVPAGDRTGGSRMRSATDVAHDCRDI